MTTSELNFLPPEAFERTGLTDLLADPEAVRTVVTAVTPAVGEGLDFSRTSPLPGPAERIKGCASTMRVPLRLRPASPDESPEAAVAVAVLPTPFPEAELTVGLRSLMVSVWRRFRPEPNAAGPGYAPTESPPPPLPPLVLALIYAGREMWKVAVDSKKLVEFPPDLAAAQPKFKILTLSLRSANPALLAKPGPFGRVLAVFGGDAAPAKTFLSLWEGALSALNAMPMEPAAEDDRRRWTWYLIHLLVYWRPLGEFPRLRQELIGAFVDTKRRREVEDMLRTVLDSCSEIGEIKARREILIELMTAKFGDLPPEDIAYVNRMSNIPRLAQLIRRTLSARDLDDMGLFDNQRDD
jgi:hypothetical protein